MDAPEAVPKKPATQRLRVGPLHILWLVSPFAYLAMGWVAPVLPELGRALAATGLMVFLTPQMEWLPSASTEAEAEAEVEAYLYLARGTVLESAAAG